MQNNKRLEKELDKKNKEIFDNIVDGELYEAKDVDFVNVYINNGNFSIDIVKNGTLITLFK